MNSGFKPMESIAVRLESLYPRLSHFSVLVLVAVNMVPLFGVLFLGWRTFMLLFLYWFENVIIGVFNVLKMITCQTKDPKGQITKAAIIPFFCLHYGIFTLVHGIFIFVMFSGFLDEGFDADGISTLETLFGGGLSWVALDFVVSHGISFGLNYLKGGEYKRTTLTKLMQEPYGRVIVMHLTIIGGGFLMMLLGAPMAGLVVMILIKIVLDVWAHVNQHFKEKPEEVIIGA